MFVYVYMIMTIIRCMNEMGYHNFKSLPYVCFRKVVVEVV